MSEIKEMVVDVFRGMCKDFVTKELVDRLEEGYWAEEFWHHLEKSELLKVTQHEEFGGANGDISDLFAICEVVGYYAVPAPVVEHMLANWVIEMMGLTPSHSLTTIFLQDEHALLLSAGKVSGTLQRVPWARVAKQLVTVTHEGTTPYLSMLDLTKATTQSSTNLAAEPRDCVIFDEVAPLSKIEISLTEVVKIIEIATAAKLSTMNGALQKAFQLTVRYTKERQQFDRPLHRFQLVQQHIALLAGEAAMADTATENMAAALLSNSAGDEVALAAIRIEEACRLVTSSAHQVHAAIGVTFEHSLQHYTRRLWAWRDEGFRAHYWQQMLASRLLQVDDVWQWMTK